MSGGLRSTLVAISTAVVIVGVSVAILLMPWFTAVMVPASGAYELSGLSPAQTLSVAEQVRSFVTHAGGTLPAEIDGRPAFDAAAVAHLRDVRDVVIAARWITLAALVGLCVLIAHAVAHNAQRALARGFIEAGYVLLAVLTLTAVAGALDFDAFFAAFHSLFFSAGTWMFPADALIIRIFPVKFWIGAAVLLGVLVALGCAGFIVVGRRLRALQAPRCDD